MHVSSISTHMWQPSQEQSKPVYCDSQYFYLSSFICKKKKKRETSKRRHGQYVSTPLTLSIQTTSPALYQMLSPPRQDNLFNTLIQRHVSFVKNDICSLKHASDGTWCTRYLNNTQLCFVLASLLVNKQHTPLAYSIVFFFRITIKRASSRILV